MSSNLFIHFPNDFIWGAATSAYQIEGAWNDEGRGLSIWDTFSHQPGKTYQGHHGDVAASHYHRWAEDVELMSNLNLKAYRFSISWPRIMPLGTGAVNEAGLDFYDRLVDALLDQGIQPFVTLFHWDLPQALQDLGGWASRDTAAHFADYAHVVAGRLGDRVKYWITHNEPLAMAMNGHLTGEHAPGIQDPFIALQAGSHLLISHGLAVAALRSTLPTGSQLGITLNLYPFYSDSESEEDHQATQRVDAIMNGLFLEPIFHGKFPMELEGVFGPLLPIPSPDDFKLISAPLDFLGINYYSRVVIKNDPNVPIGQATQVQPEGSEYSQMWEIYPQGLYDLLTKVQDQYHPQNIFITENGVPVPDGLDFDNRIRDYRRIRYLRDHITQVYRALESGVPLGGYLVWSLLDNFEWSHGYQMRFGLVYIDFETQERRVKESGRWFARVIQQNGLDLSEEIPGC